MIRLTSFIRVCLFLVLGLLAGVLPAAAFQTLELTPVPAPAGFEQTVRYQVSFFQTIDGQKVEVFPTRDEKMREFDLILAAIVRRVVDEEYEGKGKFLDETDVKPCSPQEVMHLVSAPGHSPTWGKAAREDLQRFLNQGAGTLRLQKLEAYLDYQNDKGQYVSGLDVDPILYRWGSGSRARDEVTVLMISTPEQ